MKKTKKMMAVFLSAIMLVVAYLPASAIQEETDAYEYLLNQGFSENILDNLAEETMSNMVSMIGDNTLLNVTTEEKTFCSSAGLTRGAIEEDSLTLQITSGTLGPSGSNVLSHVLVVVSWEWAAHKPIYRGKDALVVNWNESVFALSSGSFSAWDLYKSNETDDWTDTGSNTMSASNQGGLGYYTDLKGLVKYVGGNMVFMLVPTSPMYNGTSHSTNINVEYAHEYMPITGLDFSYGVGVGLSWDRGCDTMAASSLVRFSR